MDYYERRIAKEGLEMGAIKLRPEDPFTWASGFRMPIYNDNRMFLSSPECRELFAERFQNYLEWESIPHDVIAGTSTAGIPPATTLADMLGKPLIYVRDKPKGHGMKNRIEGIDADSDYTGQRAILIEDLISTGGSSVSAVRAIRDVKMECDHCLSIFNYGLDEAVQVFGSLDPECKVKSLLSYDVLLEVAREKGYINDQQARMLEEWRADYTGWGEKHGFPRVVK